MTCHSLGLSSVFLDYFILGVGGSAGVYKEDLLLQIFTVEIKFYIKILGRGEVIYVKNWKFSFV